MEQVHACYVSNCGINDIIGRDISHRKIKDMVTGHKVQFTTHEDLVKGTSEQYMKLR